MNLQPEVIFYIYVAALALLLIYPVSRMMWVLSVRRLQRKLTRELNAEELAGQKQRAYFLGFLVSMLFSFLFNLYSVGDLIK